MDFDSYYEISRTANFIYERNFIRVALQFSDEQLKDATKVASAIRNKLCLLGESEGNEDVRNVRLFVMADTTYGNCCVDEVGASHIGGDCVIHYGHTCMSPTSTLPALFIFGKASITVANCARSLSNFALAERKPIVVLYGLEYAHAIQNIKESTVFESRLCESTSKLELQFADVMSSVMEPSNDYSSSNGHKILMGTTYSNGGVTWILPEGRKMEDCILLWIGSDNSAFSNVVLTFNGCDIVRYDVMGNSLVREVSMQRTLKRRYYLVEKAKDANIIGILVGTLAVVGYLQMICQMKELIARAGKKAYTFVMGRPSPAKLANFPECDIFIYVSCAQTALLDSKEYMAPVITPYEAFLAFNRGSRWTGEYLMEFRDLITSQLAEVESSPKEPRFSFFQGGYIDDFNPQENEEEDRERDLGLAGVTERALQVDGKGSNTRLIKGAAKSGAEFLATRSYQGLDIHLNYNVSPQPILKGKIGRASGYDDEKNKQ